MLLYAHWALDWCREQKGWSRNLGNSSDPDQFGNQRQLKDWIFKTGLGLVLKECHPKPGSPKQDIRKTTQFSK